MDSWISLVENEFDEEVSDQKFQSKLLSGEITLKSEDILKIDYKNIDSIKLIRYQQAIIDQFKIFTKACMEAKKINGDFDENIKYLYWLSDVNQYLSNKLGLQKITHKNINNDNIPRSSYKFCEYSHDCEFNYPLKQNKKKHAKGCYKQHYVYNYLKTDIDSVIEYLVKNRNNISNFNQVNICINTISFVINKMKEELENIYSKYKTEYEIYHSEKSAKK